MSLFTPANHSLVGTRRVYIGQGSSPYDPNHPDHPDHVSEPGGLTILNAGDPVWVLSAWDRDYLTDAPILLYVRSENTGEATHVLACDLPLDADVLDWVDGLVVS